VLHHAQGIAQTIGVSTVGVLEAVVFDGMFPVGQDQFVDRQGFALFGLLALKLASAFEPFGDKAAVSLLALGGVVGAEEVILAVECDASLTGTVTAVLGIRGCFDMCGGPPSFRESSRFPGLTGRTSDRRKVRLTCVRRRTWV